jgi:very-short-patch-repair endonuclease
MAKKRKKPLTYSEKQAQYDVSSAITRAALHLKHHCNYNISGVKHPQIIKEYAKQMGLTIPSGADLKQWIVQQLPKRKKKGEDKKDSLKEVSEEYCTGLRKRATESEKKFRRMLGNCKIKFVFQKAIPNDFSFYIIDFFLPATGVCIEIDGEYHNDPEQARKDFIRDKFLASKDYLVLRLTNKEVMDMTEITLRERLKQLYRDKAA